MITVEPLFQDEFALFALLSSDALRKYFWGGEGTATNVSLEKPIFPKITTELKIQPLLFINLKLIVNSQQWLSLVMSNFSS